MVDLAREQWLDRACREIGIWPPIWKGEALRRAMAKFGQRQCELMTRGENVMEIENDEESVMRAAAALATERLELEDAQHELARCQASVEEAEAEARLAVARLKAEAKNQELEDVLEVLRARKDSSTSHECRGLLDELARCFKQQLHRRVPQH